MKDHMTTIGDRITYCRSSLCLTRKELSLQWGCASVPTLARWELDSVRIPQKKLLSLINFFHDNGLIVTELWLKEGENAPPILLQSNFFEALDFDSLAQEKLLDINRQMNHFIFGQVKNNLLAPFIKYGDYIGGINLVNDWDCIEGELCFLRKKIAGIVVGVFKEENHSICIQGFDKKLESVARDQVEAIGKIQWIVRRP